MALLRYTLVLACLLLSGALPASARQLSDAEQLAARIGKTVTLLRCDERTAPAIMRRALDFGAVRAVTANEHGVMERTGVAMRVEQGQPGGGPDNAAGGYLGGEIDLRFNFANWRYAFAVEQDEPGGHTTRSLQFFDPSGTAVHQLYLTSEAAAGVFDKLVADFRAPDQRAPLALAGTPPREQGARPVPENMVASIAPAAMGQLLTQAAQQKLPIMVFLGNGSVTQIFRGVIGYPAAEGGWLDVQDAGFKLRLRERAVQGGYVLQGAGVTSVEFFDRDGDPVVSFSSVRERAKPESPAWLALLRSLPRN
jgi:putative hemin transport protein